MATASQLERLLLRLEPPLQRAFMASIETIRSRASIAQLEAAVSANDLEAAMRAAGFRDSSFTELSEAIRSTYKESADAIMGYDVPKRFSAEFNMSNPRAQRWVQERPYDLIVGDILPKQRDAIRAVMSVGFQEGRNPRSVALDIAGRVGRTGRRQGGIIGLTQQQAAYANGRIDPDTLRLIPGARQNLEQLDPAYFRRQRRDRRFDAMVRRSIDEGTPLTQSQIERIVGRYEDRLLQTRAEAVARTEVMSSQNAANQEAMNQVVEEGLAEEDAITRIWDASLDSRTRPDHAAANGQERGLNEPFEVGGALLMHPGDMNGPADQVINCRCVVRNNVDFSRTAL